jgi:hypothetical protein
MPALSGDAPERNPATTPQAVICRIALPSASAALGALLVGQLDRSSNRIGHDPNLPQLQTN